ncbi:hypothetical protein BS50DRAFT_491972 [Corynespora cassiicola Philippines]|uniref:WD40 repeat-like protein n=1 Tax=Corynespora cassiicola Philippines TaxID=1448308 RepID=A0A2T2NSK7_CORCC|nr:hypothetical protein BS50DRAFT_491972 [Corynespora cassiicola Philippines]
MSLQHKNLAEVWQHLQGRHDIANILREVIGQHSVENTLQDEETCTEESVRTICWIKTILDLQRCYLSGISNVSECPPYVLPCLLPSELIFSTILYLISVKTRLFSSQTTLMTKEFTRPRRILAQTILSGLRLLLIRKEQLSIREKRKLRLAINASWQNDRLHGVERFIVSDIFAAVLDMLNDDPSREDPYANERLNARLPTYASGLYPLDIRPETFVASLIIGTMEEDWIDAYWVLYDLLWAVECAITQRCVDLRRHTGVLGSGQIEVDTDEILEQLYQTRTSLIISMFHITGPMTPAPSLLDSLAVTLLDWNEDIDHFLSRQDSVIQRSLPRAVPRNQSYGKNVLELSPYFEAAAASFIVWLSGRKSGYEQFSIRRMGLTSNDLRETVKDWVTRTASSNKDAISKEVEGSYMPVYIVDCPKLHVVPKKYLEYKLRWCDKWAFESIVENSPIVNWKEGIPCPSCTDEKIKCARLIEPLQHLATALENLQGDDYSISQYSAGESESYDATSASAISRSASDTGSMGRSLPSQSTMNISLPSNVSRQSGDSENPLQSSTNPPGYAESPSIPENTSISAPSDISSVRINTPSTESMWKKTKDTFPLPKDPKFVFSTSGYSLLLWGKGTNNLIRFDIPSNDASSIQGCRYEIPNIEAAACGNHKCAVIAGTGTLKRRLVIYDGINLNPEYETEIEISGRLGETCVAVSRNDKYVATSLNNQIHLYNLENGLKSVAFHHQIHVYELRGESGWFGSQAKGLSSREVAEEQRLQTAIISRKLYFSTDSKRLVVASQLGDHCVYVDVWDCTREPVSTISEHSRSFKLPPWTLNDGDLTGVFYDSARRAALVTAFLGKEYPVLIPFPGYDTLQNETYSTKIVHAAQSPSGSTFVVANSMTEMIQFEFTAKGTLSPRKLKKTPSKISNSVFKPEAIALAMPLENCLQCFWIKDGKCMLRSVKIGAGETFRDYDIRPHYDRLMSIRERAIIARAPSLHIPELDASA